MYAYTAFCTLALLLTRLEPRNLGMSLTANRPGVVYSVDRTKRSVVLENFIVFDLLRQSLLMPCLLINQRLDKSIDKKRRYHQL